MCSNFHVHKYNCWPVISHSNRLTDPGKKSMFTPNTMTHNQCYYIDIRQADIT